MSVADRSVAVIVAHPDDETLWAGGTILSHPSWTWQIVTLCRATDPDRGPRFFRVLLPLRAAGRMADLDDGPDQTPLDKFEVQQTILGLLPEQHFDLVISHSPAGEYTRHLRHEEIGRAVIELWHYGSLSTDELWLFAYEDGGKRYLPRPVENAPGYRILPDDVWQKKYEIVTQIYGFSAGSFEAQTTPRAESFWQFHTAGDARQWLDRSGWLP